VKSIYKVFSRIGFKNLFLENSIKINKDFNKRVLLIYPRYPDSFWSFRDALKFISKKATHPPLGLLTIATMLPADWEQKLVDMNVKTLRDKDLENVDFVFISAMVTQKNSAKEVITKCKKRGIKVVAGGPLFTSEYEDFDDVDYFVLNEAEITLPIFLADLDKDEARHIYRSKEFANILSTPLPRWDLFNMNKYVSMSIQYSRGCPFNCEFCDITNLLGRKVRSKNREQILAELESLYFYGWRGDVFFVDDNFIGNKKKLKQDILPAIIKWMETKRYPFTFNTQVSIDLSDDDELMLLMFKAGFDAVFIGIETPHEESLIECNKVQNKNRDLVACVKKIEKAGFRVTGGFIVGFDNDPALIFEKMIDFIKRSGIVSAMVGLLNAPSGSLLYKRLEKENRLVKNMSGDNTDFSLNFIPKMNHEALINGYKNIMREIYLPKEYYKRVMDFLELHKKLQKLRFHFGYLRCHLGYSGALFKSIWFIGILDEARFQYWKLFFWSLLRHPRNFVQAITLAIYGYHFRQVFKNSLRNI